MCSQSGQDGTGVANQTGVMDLVPVFDQVAVEVKIIRCDSGYGNEVWYAYKTE